MTSETYCLYHYSLISVFLGPQCCKRPSPLWSYNLIAPTNLCTICASGNHCFPQCLKITVFPCSCIFGYQWQPCIWLHLSTACLWIFPISKITYQFGTSGSLPDQQPSVWVCPRAATWESSNSLCGFFLDSAYWPFVGLTPPLKCRWPRKCIISQTAHMLFEKSKLIYTGEKNSMFSEIITQIRAVKSVVKAYSC